MRTCACLVLILAIPPSHWRRTPLKLCAEGRRAAGDPEQPAHCAARFTAAAAYQVPKEIAWPSTQPTVFGSFTGVGADNGSRLAAGGSNNPVVYNRFAAASAVGQLITDFGRTSNLIAASKLRAWPRRNQLTPRSAEILLTPDRAYFAVLRAQAVLKVAEQTVAARQLSRRPDSALAESKTEIEPGRQLRQCQSRGCQAAARQRAKRRQVRAKRSLQRRLGYPNETGFTLAEEPMPDPPARPGRRPDRRSHSEPAGTRRTAACRKRRRALPRRSSARTIPSIGVVASRVRAQRLRAIPGTGTAPSA